MNAPYRSRMLTIVGEVEVFFIRVPIRPPDYVTTVAPKQETRLPAFPQVADLVVMVGTVGFEPTTPSVSRKCSEFDSNRSYAT